MNNMDRLVETLIRSLYEGFRDLDVQLEDVKSDLYDLIDSYDINYDWDDVLNYEPNDNWYEDDIERLKELQNKLKELEDKQKEEYEKELKELPPPTNKTNFEGFDITKTDPSDKEDYLPNSKSRDYYMKKYGYTLAYITEITPEEYLLLCGKYGWKRQYNSVQDIEKELTRQGKLDIYEYAKRMKKGEKAPMPYIDIKKQGQEGRHRAFAAIQAGIKTIPCLILA